MSKNKNSKNLEELLLDDLSKSSKIDSQEKNSSDLDGLDPNLWKSGHEVPSSNSEAESQSLWEFEKEPGPEIPDKIIPKELPVFEGSDPSALVASDLDEKMESASEKPDLLELELSDAPKSPSQKPFQGQNFPEDQKNFVHTQVVNADNKTQNSQTQENQNPEATVAVAGLSFQSNKPQFQNVRVAVGQNQGVRASGGQVFTSADASLLQADNLRIAQQRILELEKEIDDLRYENDQLGSAGDVIRQKYEELTTRNFQLEKERNDLAESFQTEIAILKGKIEFRDVELVKAKNKVDEFEQRLKQDFKKIRIREKELENRVELMKLEQSAIIKSKDEQILDLRRKVGQWEDEIEVYRAKVFEHNKTIENQQEQFKRAIRALRVAFSSLEGHGESTQENLVPLKKAE